MTFDREPDETLDLSSILVETGDYPDACVIWLHGLGADGSDFEGIVSQLLLPASLPTRFMFPDAPVRPVTINGGYMMRAWYDIYDAIAEDSEQDEAGILQSASVINLLIEQQIEAGIAPERIILAGFSQGGAVALYAALTQPRKLAGVIALSTYLPLVEQFANGCSHQLDRVFMAHGHLDTVVPYRFGEMSQLRLRELGVTVDWHSYPMEHSVCGEEILAIREWLIETLS